MSKFIIYTYTSEPVHKNSFSFMVTSMRSNAYNSLNNMQTRCGLVVAKKRYRAICRTIVAYQYQVLLVKICKSNTFHFFYQFLLFKHT